MTKISFDDWKNSMSFMIDDSFDNNFLRSIDPLIEFVNQKCHEFSDPHSLSRFLTVDDTFSAYDKLRAIVSLIGLSEERLKRVVSLIRHSSEDFKTEWDIRKISKTLQTDRTFRELLIDFFIGGRASQIGREVPLYYMRNFKLTDPYFISDLRNFRYVERILNDNEIQGKYSNKVGAHVENIIKARLENYKVTHNNSPDYAVQKEFPLLNKNVDFLIPDVTSPKILIESSYIITTSSGQSKRADQLVEFYSTLMRHNANHRDNKIIMLNYCDGFGWIGRQSDLHRIYDASDFVFNQKNLSVLDEVLNAYYPAS